MSLDYPGEWMFEDSDTMPRIPESLIIRLWKILIGISDTADLPRVVTEEFKRRFGKATSSTSLDWAKSDLGDAMKERGKHAVSFIDSFWAALQYAAQKKLKTPSEAQVNKWLIDENVPFQINGTQLIHLTSDTSTSTTSSSISPGYQLGEIIGQGGFATVRIATKETSGGIFEFAYKLLDPSSFIQDKEKAFERFKREIRAVQKLQHRAIVQYVDAGLNLRGQPFLVMQRILGRNIRDATEGNPAFAIALMIEVLRGLDHAHANQVIHRDLKPNNIIVRTSDQQPVIVDFGTAFFMDDLDSTSLSSAAVSSLGYIPSEVIANPKLRSPLHDIYSCAVILYELIARQRPNPQEYLPLAKRTPELSSIDSVLMEALGPPTKRPQTADAFKTAISGANPY